MMVILTKITRYTCCLAESLNSSLRYKSNQPYKVLWVPSNLVSHNTFPECSSHNPKPVSEMSDR